MVSRIEKLHNLVAHLQHGFSVDTQQHVAADIAGCDNHRVFRPYGKGERALDGNFGGAVDDIEFQHPGSGIGAVQRIAGRGRGIGKFAATFAALLRTGTGSVTPAFTSTSESTTSDDPCTSPFTDFSNHSRMSAATVTLCRPSATSTL